ncbi:MAG TPA: FtsX-like permease family protein, partial [Gammaproteobacteria bacterium]|nr:FtsX-like permease family protein [Gammaproteobacteria bacterium]
AEIHGIKVNPPGRFLNVLDDVYRRQVIVLGLHSVERLFKPKENPVGQYIFVDNSPFMVIGVQRKNLQLLSTGKMPDDYLNWIPYSTYQALTANRNYTGFIIAPNQLADIPRIEQEIRKVIARTRGLNADDPGILNVINLQEEKEKLILFLKGMEWILGVIGGLTLLVAGVGIANVMYISVKRATREIGIRMALGARTYEILCYYTVEAVLTTLLGGLLGFLLAFGLIYFLQHLPVQSEVMEHLGNPRPVLSFNVIFIVMLVLGTIGLLSGIFPARKASLIHPAEALRHEK